MDPVRFLEYHRLPRAENSCLWLQAYTDRVNELVDAARPTQQQRAHRFQLEGASLVAVHKPKRPRVSSEIYAPSHNP